jgi:hypothetical protein
MPPPFENEKTIIESQVGQHRSTVPSSEEPNHFREGLTHARDLRLHAECEAALAPDYHTASHLGNPKHRKMSDLQLAPLFA